MMEDYPKDDVSSALSVVRARIEVIAREVGVLVDWAKDMEVRLLDIGARLSDIEGRGE